MNVKPPGSRKTLKLPKKLLWGKGKGIGLLLGILFCIALFIKHHYYQHNTTKPLIAVALTTVATKNIPVFISALGNITATYTVTVKTQVNGLLMKVHFKEGQLVKSGDLLAEIDKRPLLAQLTQYEGQLVRDQALLANSLIDLKRYRRLWKEDSISQQTLATQESLVRQYEGTVKIDEGLIESTKVSLLYCNITSPLDGRIGLRLIDPGNVVQVSDTTGIAVLTTISPITVIFSVPEDDIPQILANAPATKNFQVQAYDRQQNKLLATGTLLTWDNQIDVTTGTVKLKAQFDNKDNKLFPNQFVNIQLLVDTLSQATVVATAAIQHGSKGDFVYRVNPDSSVTKKAVKTGISYGDDTVIEQGIAPGESVVVEGADKLSEGSKVHALNNTHLK